MKGSDECAICKELATLVEDYLKDNKDKVLDEIAKLCDLLPKADQQAVSSVVLMSLAIPSQRASH